MNKRRRSCGIPKRQASRTLQVDIRVPLTGEHIGELIEQATLPRLRECGDILDNGDLRLQPDDELRGVLEQCVANGFTRPRCGRRPLHVGGRDSTCSPGRPGPGQCADLGLAAPDPLAQRWHRGYSHSLRGGRCRISRRLARLSRSQPFGYRRQASSAQSARTSPRRSLRPRSPTRKSPPFRRAALPRRR